MTYRISKQLTIDVVFTWQMNYRKIPISNDASPSVHRFIALFKCSRIHSPMYLSYYSLVSPILTERLNSPVNKTVNNRTDYCPVANRWVGVHDNFASMMYKTWSPRYFPIGANMTHFGTKCGILGHVSVERCKTKYNVVCWMLYVECCRYMLFVECCTLNIVMLNIVFFQPNYVLYNEVVCVTDSNKKDWIYIVFLYEVHWRITVSIKRWRSVDRLNTLNKNYQDRTIINGYLSLLRNFQFFHFIEVYKNWICLN